tara:strand:- start:69 stop:371 length:303 start_codon:yes stop_codon:yes gene_type:complete
MASQSIPRAANPTLMFRSSSKTIVVKRKHTKSVNVISSIGAFSKSNGCKYQRKPKAMFSGVVVYKIKLADCKTVNVRHDELTARFKALLVIWMGPRLKST